MRGLKNVTNSSKIIALFFKKSILRYFGLEKNTITNYLRGRGVFLNSRSMDDLFLKRVNSWQGLVKKEQEPIFEK